jgi:hypothetical protein
MGNRIVPTRFWIIGAGRFGRIAVVRILGNTPGATISLVDKEPRAIDDARVNAIHADGIAWLHAELCHAAPVDMIVPAIPLHVAAEWLKLALSNRYEVRPADFPDACLKLLPNAIRGPTGRVFVSHADFICPDNCLEPEKICTHTGKPRPVDLFRLLENFTHDNYLPIVIRSHQMFPGVGGIYPAALLDLLETARKNTRRPLMVGTACRCHGVVDCMRLTLRH